MEKVVTYAIKSQEKIIKHQKHFHGMRKALLIQSGNTIRGYPDIFIILLL